MGAVKGGEGVSGPTSKWVKGWRLLRSLRPAPRGAGLSVVMPLAYDWRMALESLRRCYGIADEVVVGLDAQRISWAGRLYAFQERAFRAALKRLDPAGKIRVVEGVFHGLPHPGDNETAERNALSLACREGNWVVQIDADELMLNPAAFRAWLLAQPMERQVLAQWFTVYKTLGRTALVIDGGDRWTSVATCRRGAYVEHRATGAWKLRSPLKLLHFSWGRSEVELRQKLSNWGHAKDFDTAAFLRRWKSVTLKNYAAVKDFHPLGPELWPRLRAVPLDRLESWAGGDR